MVETAANVATLGGYGGVKKAYAEGRITATDSMSGVKAYAEGVFNTITLGGGERAVDAYAEGKGAGEIAAEAAKGVVETVLPINEVKTLVDPSKNAWEKAEAIATGTAKVAGLAAGGLAAKNAIAQRLANKPGIVTESATGAEATMAPATGGRTASFAGKQRFDATQLSAEQVDTAILKSIRRKSGAMGTPSGQIAADASQTQFILEKTTAWRRNVHATDPGYASLRSLAANVKGTYLHSSVQSRIRRLNIEGLDVNQRLYGASPYISPATGVPFEYRIPDFKLGSSGGTIFDLKPRGTPLAGPQYQDFRSFGRTNDVRWIGYDPY